MRHKQFTAEVETYTVLILHLDEYKSSRKDLPAGFEFLKPVNYVTVREQERALLQQRFDDWNIPYCHSLPGWRTDSPIMVMHGQRLVGGVYLYDRNEFDSDPIRGQVHYAFIDSNYQGQGLYSVMFREIVERAHRWGLRELYLNSDRYMLPEVYLRWGARPWQTITKSSRLPQNGIGRLLSVGHEPLRTARRNLRRIRLRLFKPCK